MSGEPSPKRQPARAPAPPEGTLTHLPSSTPAPSTASPSSPTPAPQGTLTHLPSSGPSASATAPEGTLTHAPSSGGGVAPVGTLTHLPSSGREPPRRLGSDAPTPDLAPLRAATSAPPGLAAERARERFDPGDVLEGLYEVRELLGEGGMGAVYRVRHLEWGAELAMKTPLPRLLRNQEALRRFQREAEAWTDLGLHPHIARCYYLREVAGLPRIFVELATGGTLKDWLRARRPPGSGPEWAEPLRLALEAADGLGYAHARGLVHRDVKPANCLLSERGALRITDFGLVKQVGEAEAPSGEGALGAAGPELTNFEAGMGTPEYAAPEQWSAARDVDARADIYAFGVMLWELATGRRPYDVPGEREPPLVLVNRHCHAPIPDPREHAPGLPPGLPELLRRLLAKEPAARPASFAEVRAALEGVWRAAVNDRPPPAPEPPRTTAAALCNRALSLRDLGQDDAAELAWGEALHLEPHHPEASYDLGLVRWRRGELGDAELVSQLEEVRRSHTRIWMDELLLAQVQLERGDGAAAATLLAELPPEARARPEVQAVSAAAAARAAGPVPAGAPLPRYATATTQLVAWSADYLLYLSDPLNRMGETPGMPVFTRDGRRLLQLDLQGRAGTVGRTALAGPGCARLAGDLALAACLSGHLRGWRLPGCELALEEVHPGPLHALDAAPEWARALVGGELPGGRGQATAWDLERLRRLGTCDHEDGPVLAVALGPGGAEAWSAGPRLLRVWDPATGAVRGEWELAEVHGILALPDGARLVLELPDGAWLWDRNTGERLRRFGRRARRRLLGRAGRTLVEVADDGLRLWDIEAGRCVRTVEPPPGPPVWACELDEDAAALLLPAGPGEPLRRLPLPHLSAPYRAPLALARVSSSEAELAVERTFARHLSAGRRALRASDAPRAVRALRLARTVEGFARHPEVLAAWERASRLVPRRGLRAVWVAAELREGCPAPRAPRCAFSARGERVAWSVAGRTWIYDLGARRVVARLPSGGAPQFLPSGLLRLDLEVWDPGSGERVRALPLSPGGRVERYEHDEAGRLLLGTPHGALWDLERGLLLRVAREAAPGQPSPLRAALLPGGELAVATIRNGQLGWWDLATDAPLDKVTAGSQAFGIEVVRLDPSGSRVLLAGRVADQAMLQVWDAERRTLVGRLEDTGGRPLDVALGLDRATALLADDAGRLALLDTRRGELLRELPRQDPPAEQVAFSPDGVHALSASPEGVVLWRLDWDLGEEQPRGWDGLAEAYLRAFCHAHLQPAGARPDDVEAFVRRRPPVRWSEVDLEDLDERLGAAGLAWLGRERVREELARVKVAVERGEAPPEASRVEVQPRRAAEPARPQGPGTGILARGERTGGKNAATYRAVELLDEALVAAQGRVRARARFQGTVSAVCAAGALGAFVGLAAGGPLLAGLVLFLAGCALVTLFSGRDRRLAAEVAHELAQGGLGHLLGRVDTDELELWLRRQESLLGEALRGQALTLRAALE
ncbi:MAG: protein kinase [Planctomycetota bacterium]